ncbi:MAG: hypothetical protein MJZ60_10510, partial [Bacteroidaceae bacterium]|nr:hypothetical protein [Bacteroidaceae bacterium]
AFWAFLSSILHFFCKNLNEIEKSFVTLYPENWIHPETLAIKSGGWGRKEENMQYKHVGCEMIVTEEHTHTI